MSVDVEIAVEADGWAGRPGLEPRVAAAVRAAIAQSGVHVDGDSEVSVLLCDDAFIAELNGRWRGKATPTNVLSFPSGLKGRALGDIAVAFETTAREARAEGKTLEDHVTHLAVHGCLHLLGFDHETAPEAEAMEDLERRILASLGVADPYAESLVRHTG
jgi:probable rRNA maturation factor